MKQIYIYIAILVLLTVSCSRKEKKDANVISVKTMQVSLATQGITKNYVGTVEEEEGVNVTFTVTGTVKRIMVDEGQFVKAGQALAESDGITIRNAYEMSKVTLEQAEDAYRRMKNLYEKGTLPEIRMVEMESQLQRARSAEAISRHHLESIILRAPWSGYIASKSIHEGANILPGTNGFRLVKIEHMKVNVPVPEKEIGKINVGDDITFKVSALGDRTFAGKVVSKSMAANPISHAYVVKVLVDNKDHALLPGMVANVYIKSYSPTYQLLIPQQAISVSGKDKFVWLVKGGKATRRNITTGDISNDGVVVESGLSSGEKVIIEGQTYVSEGVSVKEKK